MHTHNSICKQTVQCFSVLDFRVYVERKQRDLKSTMGDKIKNEVKVDGNPDGKSLETERAFIHSLPTEILVYIFTWLSVEDLGINVSKVCQRWRDAMHFRTLWRDKELVYGHEELFLFVLSVAPCLRTLTITPLTCEDSGAVISSIRKGPKDIKIVNYNLSLFSSDAGARILGHYKDHVSELHLVGYAKQSSIYRNLGAVFAQMPRLKSLKLSGNFDTKWNKCDLEQSSFELHHLDVSFIQDESSSYLPFLDHVKTHLLSLKLPQYKSNVDVLHSVECCTKLKEITLCLDDVRCISNLQSLESLHIRWSDGILKNKISQFIRDCPVFENLKELTLHYIPGPIASAIAKRCHKLEVLSLHGITSCTSIIKTMPSLQKLYIVDRLSLRMRNVQKLPRYLPNLKYVNLIGSFVNRGIPPKIVSQLKEELPGLQVLSDPFTSYKKRGSKAYFTKCADSSTDCSSDEA